MFIPREESRANRETLAMISRVQPKDPAKVAEEVRAYLKQVKARKEAPAVEGSYCGNVGKAHRAGGW